MRRPRDEPVCKMALFTAANVSVGDSHSGNGSINFLIELATLAFALTGRLFCSSIYSYSTYGFGYVRSRTEERQRRVADSFARAGPAPTRLRHRSTHRAAFARHAPL